MNSVQLVFFFENFCASSLSAMNIKFQVSLKVHVWASLSKTVRILIHFTAEQAFILLKKPLLDRITQLQLTAYGLKSWAMIVGSKPNYITGTNSFCN